MAITYAFLSANERKSAEYRLQMAKYAREVRILPWSDDRQVHLPVIRQYLAAAEEKDRFALRETSDLYVADDWDGGTLTISTKKTPGERVYNVSTLRVFTLGADGEVKETVYTGQIEGHIDLSLKHDVDWWWDDVFVPSRSKKSYASEAHLWHKSSARQQALGRFICDHLMFKRLKDVKHNPHRPAEAVDFSPTVSALSVLRGNQFVRMADFDRCPWGLGNLLSHVTGDGAFFRSADSRRSGNYFCPPISGIPRHEKPDPFWETTYQLHDFFHQAVPDQMFTGVSSPAHRHVYVAARLMSEGLTIVMADMLFVEAIKASGFQYDFSARNINPLFGSLTLPEGTKREQLKALLHANVSFANLGDEGPYRAMLKPGCDAAFEGYTGTYKNFFIPDLVWSVQNYDDMVARQDQFAAWVEMLGRPLFARAKLPLLDDLVDSLTAAGHDLSTYSAAVGPVFEHLFENVLAPRLAVAAVVSDERAQSNAFLRYMIGQCFIYATYRNVEGVAERGRKMVAVLTQIDLFTQELIAQVRDQFAADLAFLQTSGIITADDQSMYKQMVPLFSPRFLSYDFGKTLYPSIAAAVVGTFGAQAPEQTDGAAGKDTANE